MSLDSPSFSRSSGAPSPVMSPSEEVVPPGPSSDEMWPESRAREVLDQLIRDRQRRPLFRRGGSVRGSRPAEPAGSPGATAAAAGSPHEDGGATPGRRARDVRAVLGVGVPGSRLPGRRTLVTAALVVLVPLGLFARQLWARPPSLDTRLPIASEEAAAADGSSTSIDSPATAGAPGAEPSADTAVAPGGQAATLMVHVAGAVASPGVVQLGAEARVVDAVRAAGGLRADADPDRVNLAAPLVDGSRVVVPVLGQAPPVEVGSVPPVAAEPDAGGGPGAAATSPGAAVDLNTATVSQLDELPGVGPTTAQAIVDHRASEGPFDSVDALLDVRGIGDAKLAALRDLVTVG